MTGKITQDITKRYKLVDGVLTGRWDLSEVFASIGQKTIAGKPICKGDAFYSAFKTQLCIHRDIVSALQGPTAACDAMSFAMGFATEPAQLGVPWDAGQPQAWCAAEQDPSTDACPG